MTDQGGQVVPAASPGRPEGPRVNGPADAGIDPGDRTDAVENQVGRTAARLTAHEMLLDVQWGPPPPLSSIATLVEAGDLNGWHEVSVIGRCAAALAVEASGAWRADERPDATDTAGGGGAHPAAAEGEADEWASLYDALHERVDDMRRRADAAHDPALLAMVLSFRSTIVLRRARREGRTVTGAEGDLASAVVLLEKGEGGALERVCAHNTCGVAFSMMAAWELAERQYEAAARIDPIALEPFLSDHTVAAGAPSRAVAYSLVEMHVHQACARRVAGDLAGAAASALAAIRRVERVRSSPVGWSSLQLAELESCRLLALALTGKDVSAEAAEAVVVATGEAQGTPPLLSGRGGFDVDVMRAGNAALALALSLPSAGADAAWAAGSEVAATAGSDAARAAADAAVVTLQIAPMPLVALAMDLAARAEGASAAARLVQAQTEQLWNGRRRSVDSMEALIRTERLRSRSEELERHAHIDELTGLANRRGFYRYLNDLLVERRTRVSLLVVDIDRFKEVNDRYGHPVGDHALRRLASVLLRLVRPLDLAARLGGDEFFLLLEGTGPQVAIERAETIVRTIGEPGPGEHDLALSVTIGVASGPPTEFDRLLAEADGALYRGKSTGGGRWVSSSPPAAPNL